MRNCGCLELVLPPLFAQGVMLLLGRLRLGAAVQTQQRLSCATMMTRTMVMKTRTKSCQCQTKTMRKIGIAQTRLSRWRTTRKRTTMSTVALLPNQASIDPCRRAIYLPTPMSLFLVTLALCAVRQIAADLPVQQTVRVVPALRPCRPLCDGGGMARLVKMRSLRPQPWSLRIASPVSMARLQKNALRVWGKILPMLEAHARVIVTARQLL
mmetsp:Transcript_8871/g.28128  ORF Transcript_8871/g.28128 Transcript_8871/m.28128 type:complete len:211 (+) Transcript_8871:3331-3963(+)